MEDDSAVKESTDETKIQRDQSVGQVGGTDNNRSRLPEHRKYSPSSYEEEDSRTEGRFFSRHGNEHNPNGPGYSKNGEYGPGEECNFSNYDQPYYAHQDQYFNSYYREPKYSYANAYYEQPEQLRPQRESKRRAKQRICSNCQATNTPSWRRGGNGKTLLCNACGLYQKLHNRPRPYSITAEGKTKALKGSYDKAICMACNNVFSLSDMKASLDGTMCDSCSAYFNNQAAEVRGIKQGSDMRRGGQGVEIQGMRPAGDPRGMPIPRPMGVPFAPEQAGIIHTAPIREPKEADEYPKAGEKFITAHDGYRGGEAGYAPMNYCSGFKNQDWPLAGQYPGGHSEVKEREYSMESGALKGKEAYVNCEPGYIDRYAARTPDGEMFVPSRMYGGDRYGRHGEDGYTQAKGGQRRLYSKGFDFERFGSEGSYYHPMQGAHQDGGNDEFYGRPSEYEYYREPTRRDFYFQYRPEYHPHPPRCNLPSDHLAHTHTDKDSYVVPESANTLYKTVTKNQNDKTDGSD